ncbi:methylmalonyl-CoA epimerase [Candidatus Bathyarchaeota archaeon]|nr:methylmalonyl-CoA epimerase [Candidatus Bathyarchaeota archaeon]
MITGIRHIGVAVSDLDEAIKLYRDILGLRLEDVRDVKEMKMRVAFFSTNDKTEIELIQPTDNETSLAKFIEKRGEGIHHVAFEVDDIESALAMARTKGLLLIDEKPRVGVHGDKIAFIHPKSTRGVLLEFVMK